MKRFVLILVALVVTLVLAAPVAAGFTPTPAVPTATPEPVVDPAEECVAQLVIELLTNVPDGMVVSGWVGGDGTVANMPEGKMVFERLWQGQILGIPITKDVVYQVWGWTEKGGWVHLFAIEAGACVDVLGQYVFDEAAPVPTPVLLPDTGASSGAVPWTGLALGLACVGMIAQGIVSGRLLPNRRSGRAARRQSGE